MNDTNGMLMTRALDTRLKSRRLRRLYSSEYPCRSMD